MQESNLVPVVYGGPDHTCTLHITSSPLVFPKGEPVLVSPNVRESLFTLSDNCGNKYDWFHDYVAPSPAPQDAGEFFESAGDGDVPPKGRRKKET